MRRWMASIAVQGASALPLVWAGLGWMYTLLAAAELVAWALRMPGRTFYGAFDHFLLACVIFALLDKNKP